MMNNNINKIKEKNQNEAIKKPRRWLIFFASLAAIVVAGGMAYGVSYLMYFYANWDHPIGDEAAAMMSKIKFINNNFPHFNWLPQWDGGQPGFWIYLPLSFMIGSVFVRWLSFTYTHSLTLIGLISYILIAIGIYGITSRLAKNRLAALFAAALAITSQGLWYWDGAGYYARTFGMGFYFLAFWAGIALVQKIEKQGKVFPLPKAEFFLTIIFFFLAGYSHTFSNYLIAGTLFLLFLVGISGWLKKILATVFVIGGGIFLSAFYYFLMLQANFQFYNRLFFHRTYEPHPLRLFWNLKIFEGYAGAPEVSPLILPLVALLLFWLIISRRRFVGFTRSEKSIFWLLVFFFVVSLYYPLQGSFYLPKLFYIFLLVCDAPFLVSVFGAIIIGVLTATVLRSLHKVFRYLVPVILLGLVAWLTIAGLLFLTKDDKWPRRFINQEEGFVTRLKIDAESKQFRMGTTNPQWAEAFNYFYDVPQNRDYFGQGVVYDDWQFWQQACVWDKKCGYPETDYLIDWFSLKWILTTASAVDSSFEKFNALPEKYELAYRENPNFSEFIPKEVSPILFASNTPTVLVIGEKKTSYDMLIRATAAINLNSQHLIPIRGKEYIDQYSLEELRPFSLIYLYKYKYKNNEKASNLLKEYVAQGGGLVVEGMLSPENLKLVENSLASPLPAGPLREKTRNKDWHFTATPGEITRDIKFDLFAPAVYEEINPWKIVTVSEPTTYDTILHSDGEPVILASEQGKGRVVWMGLNLNFHINTFHNSEEGKLFRNILAWASQNKVGQAATVDHLAVFIHPERREITVNTAAKGVLNKEYYFPAWKAYLEQDSQRKELKIYRGGLDQQYIPLPQDIKTPYKVVMVYERWTSEKIGFVVSGVTLILLLVYLFEGKLYPPVYGPLWKKISGLVRRQTVSWWDKDEE